MEEPRSYLGLVSFLKSELTPLFDVKHENASTEMIGLSRSWNKKQLQPITICFLDGKPFILDGVQRWKLSNESQFILCFSLGELTKEEAFTYWFQLDNVIGINILKMSQLISELDVNLLLQLSTISKLDLEGFMDLKKLKEFDFETFLKKHAEKSTSVQTILFERV